MTLVGERSEPLTAWWANDGLIFTMLTHDIHPGLFFDPGIDPQELVLGKNLHEDFTGFGVWCRHRFFTQEALKVLGYTAEEIEEVQRLLGVYFPTSKRHWCTVPHGPKYMEKTVPKEVVRSMHGLFKKSNYNGITVLPWCKFWVRPKMNKTNRFQPGPPFLTLRGQFV